MKIKVISFILSLIMLMPLMISCVAEEEPKTDDKEKVEYDGLVINDEYIIVRGDMADKATIKSAAYLHDQINSVASLNVGLKTDFYKKVEEITEKEIIVGNTNRETEFDRTTLKEGEWYVGIEGSKIIIDAYDSETLYFAVQEFASKWLTKDLGIQKDGVLLINEEICNKLTGIDTALNDSIIILSQNLRSGNDGNGNDIVDRQPRFQQLVEQYSPDIIGTQEMTKSWYDFLKSGMFSKVYGIVGCSRDGRTATTGEWNAILYRLDRFELLDSDTFWLSSTPEKKSMVEGSICYRICTWALLKDKQTGKTILMCNTHLDHGTDEVREEQAKILVSYLKRKFGDYPTYLTGDFNCTPGSLAYKSFSNDWMDSHDEAIVDKSTTQNTFHGYGNPSKEIDFCFYNGMSTPVSYYIVNDDYNGYVSDHYGVLVKFVVN